MEKRVKIEWEDATAVRYIPQVRGWSSLGVWRHFYHRRPGQPPVLVGFDSLAAAETFLETEAEEEPPRKGVAYHYPAPHTQQPVAQKTATETETTSRDRDESDSVVVENHDDSEVKPCAAGSCVWGIAIDRGFSWPCEERRCGRCGRIQILTTKGWKNVQA